LIDHFPDYSTATGSLLMECGEGQVPAIQRYASECGRRSFSRMDLAGIPRAVHVEMDPAG
jgi:methylase of polypeptide subunit release factors